MVTLLKKMFVVRWALPAALVMLVGLSTGCARHKDLLKVNEEQTATISAMTSEINRLNQELDELYGAREELLRAKGDLEQKLAGELEAGSLSLSMQDRGLVVTVLDRILFASGKAELKSQAEETLQKVGEILTGETNDNLVYVEGHTDSQPIQRSGWRSNWELSTARATEVIHYFIEKRGIEPRRLVASGYGQHYPVASNDNAEGREKNRRVEIVISPQKLASSVVARTT